MNITDALTTYANTLETDDRDPEQLSRAKSDAASALEGASSLLRLRWHGWISPKEAAEKIRADLMDAGDLRKWARTIDAFQKHVHENPKIEVVMRVLPSDFTPRDWLDLALAAIDQAGVAVGVQERIEAMLPRADEDEA